MAENQPGTNKNRMSQRDPFFKLGEQVREFFSGDAAANPFEDLALEMFALQFHHNAPYRRYCEAVGRTPATVTDWRQVPAVPASGFKEFDFSCIPASRRSAVFCSSGTTRATASRHHHCAESLALYEASVRAGFERHFRPPFDCVLILTPPPSQAPHSSLVHMFETIGRAFSRRQAVWAGRMGPGGVWEVDARLAGQQLETAAAAGGAVLVLGTALTHLDLITALEAQGMHFKLPPGSLALETGGYKGRTRNPSKTEFYRQLSDCLGIPQTSIVGEYGMCELSSQAYDVRPAVPAFAPATEAGIGERRFTFPPWGRARIVSPETGEEVGDGRTGLVRVYDLANVYSVMAVQTEDLAVRRGDGFELLGRAAGAERRGCSLLAA